MSCLVPIRVNTGGAINYMSSVRVHRSSTTLVCTRVRLIVHTCVHVKDASKLLRSFCAYLHLHGVHVCNMYVMYRYPYMFQLALSDFDGDFQGT